MNEIIKNIEAAQLKEVVPSFNVGDTVRVSAKIKEGNRERIQVFEGTVVIKFVPQFVLIRFIGTHKEYDEIDCSTI